MAAIRISIEQVNDRQRVIDQIKDVPEGTMLEEVYDKDGVTYFRFSFLFNSRLYCICKAMLRKVALKHAEQCLWDLRRNDPRLTDTSGEGGM